MIKQFILCWFFLFCLLSVSAEASGAAARRGNVNIQGGKKTYRVNSLPQPGVWPTPKPPQQEAEPEPSPEVPEKKKVDQYFPPPEVLVSSSHFQEPGAVRCALPREQKQQTGVDPQMVELINRFDQSSELWFQVKDPRAKALILSRYIDLYRRFDTVIEKSPMHYANLIDSMARENPSMFVQPLDQILRVVAILEYDYDNGENKDGLARSILDGAGFSENKRRLGIQ